MSMEHNVDFVHQAETIWLHYQDLLNSKQVKTPEFQKVVTEQELYCRERYLRLTEEQAPTLLASVGITIQGTDNSINQ